MMKNDKCQELYQVPLLQNLHASYSSVCYSMSGLIGDYRRAAR
ncbi:hypothetical protein HanPSC8_Chr12g0543461 [Helianthus annuus]|nr:hypothetical protein HanPSC8_Chr12g0543461 [Helianthus annuus]